MLNTSNAPIFPVASITNTLPFPVDIYDVYNTNAPAKGPLTYTKLGTAPANSGPTAITTIRPFSQVQAMRSGSIPAFNNKVYCQAAAGADSEAESSMEKLDADLEAELETEAEIGAPDNNLEQADADVQTAESDNAKGDVTDAKTNLESAQTEITAASNSISSAEEAQLQEEASDALKEEQD